MAEERCEGYAGSDNSNTSTSGLHLGPPLSVTLTLGAEKNKAPPVPALGAPILRKVSFGPGSSAASSSTTAPSHGENEDEGGG